MILAITAMSAGLDAPVDLRFGRARGFVLVDTDTGGFLSLDNKGESGVWQGAGFQTAEMLTRHGVEAVLTGRFGPNALQALRNAGIRAYTGLAGGSVRQALEQFLAGSFQEASAAEVPRDS
ncbi:MAG: NifB/NifX family molybdenum-iron cluster-binding protein [Chloroflexi bacterium]|nr:NifB/NifX family molybdenum-iron cluster-binding protein [Chloroflexota bacterium]